ncbi:type IV pilus assembly protein PilM [bacterium]|nr:type IV pilus assembly protein PilM [bacterium]
MKFFENKDLVGLDIGASAIKVVQLARNKNKEGKGYELIKLAFKKLPPEVISEDGIQKPEVVAETIKKVFDENKIDNKNIATSISGRSVIVKKIKLPKMIDEELEESIQWEAEQFIPFDINDVSLDFQIISKSDGPDDEMDVLLVAVKKDRIADIVNLVELAELKPVVVDIDAFALENQFEENYTPLQDGFTALIDIGAETTCINILKGNASSFTRDASIGINQFHRNIQRDMLIDFEQSEALLKGHEVEGRSKDDIQPSMNGFLDELLAEFQRSFDYFRATAEDSPISNIYLSGGAGMIEGLPEFLNEKLGIHVEIVDPFKNILIDPKRFDMEFIASIAPMMAVVVGLGLRRIGDR